MVNVWAKLGQAEYFLGEMGRVQANRQKFIYQLSAFLSACWSVGCYLKKIYGEDWFEAVKRRTRRGEFPHIAYYIDKRNSDVHDDVLDVLGTHSVKVNGRLPRPATEYAHQLIATRDENGNLVSLVFNDGSGSPQSYEYTEEHRYSFPGGEVLGKDVLSECFEYFMELRSIAIEATPWDVP